MHAHKHIWILDFTLHFMQICHNSPRHTDRMLLDSSTSRLLLRISTHPPQTNRENT